MCWRVGVPACVCVEMVLDALFHTLQTPSLLLSPGLILLGAQQWHGVSSAAPLPFFKAEVERKQVSVGTSLEHSAEF